MVIAMGRATMTRMTIALDGDDDYDEDDDDDYGDDRVAMTNDDDADDGGHGDRGDAVSGDSDWNADGGDRDNWWRLRRRG